MPPSSQKDLCDLAQNGVLGDEMSFSKILVAVDTSEVILNTSKTIQADLIILGSKGM